MKREISSFILVLLVSGTPTLEAHDRDYYRPAYHHSGGGWVVPLIMGGMIGYAVSRPNVVYTTTYQPTVYTTTSRPYIIESERNYVSPYPISMPAGNVYEERIVYFDDCQCERKVLINVQP